MAQCKATVIAATLGVAALLVVSAVGEAWAQGRSFRDWYAACSESAASCRADTFIKGENNPIGFDFRLSWERPRPDQPFRLVFNPLFDPVASSSALTLRVDSEPATTLRPGTGYRAAGDDRYVVLGEESNADLMEKMRAGSAMTIAYRTADGEDLEIEASLLGLTAALRHVEDLRPSQAPAEPEEAPEETPEETPADAPEETAEEPAPEETAEEAAGQEAEAQEPPEETATPANDAAEEAPLVRLDGEWPEDLFVFEKAMAACLEATENKPARVGVAWALDAENVAVRLDPWEGEAELCLAAWSGEQVAEIRPLTEEDAAPASGPVFSPIEFGKPEGECFEHEPVAQEDGAPIGWLSFNTCD